MKISWNILPYICIIAYVGFIFFSVNECMHGMQDFYDVPYHVTREVREIRARLQTLRNTMPGAFASPNMSYEQIMGMLDVHNQRQDKSIGEIRARFQNDPEGLIRQLDDAVLELRNARKRVAKETEHNKNPEYVTAHYNEEISPPLNKLDEILLKISRAADDQGNSIRQGFADRHYMVEGMAIFMAFFLIALLIYIDVRDRAKNRTIRHHEQLFNLLCENVDDVFIISNSDGSIDYASSNSERVLGLAAAEIMRDPGALYAYLGKEAGEWLKKNLDADSDSGNLEAGGNAKETTAAHGAQVLKLRVYPAHGEGDSERYITVISDETKAIENQRALVDALESSRSANAAKSNFLAHMSHEIRTPMNAIIGMTAIAITRIDDKARVEDCLDKIGQSSRHLLGIINDVLDMSKIEGGKLAINHESFDLRQIVGNIINLIQPQTVERKQHFDVLLDKVEEESLIGDPLRLNQILINLLSNALKFTPAEGSISLTISQAEKKHNQVRLSFVVKDSGMGMSQEFLRRLYQPFEQATPGISSKFGGSGLGLAITRNLVSLMGGAITVKSEEGAGTEFTVDLPFGIDESKNNTKNRNLPSLKILVVDDDPGTCEHAGLILNKMGMDVYGAHSGNEALQMLKRAHEQGEPFEVCFLDWKMPGMDGAQTARRIREEFGDETLIIIISAYDWTPIEKQARDAGVTAFVAKPFFASTLFDTLLNVTRKMEKGIAEKKDNKCDFRSKRVLLVEDNDFNREIGVEFLEMAGVDVENAVNGQEAVEMVSNSSPGYYDLILMDVQMPVMNGYDATRAIRRLNHPDARTLPILAMTANAFSDDVAAALEAGMNGHIAKPINMNELYGKMAGFLN